MLKIMLVCSAGMSTNVLSEIIEEAAKAKGIDAKVWSSSEFNFPNEIQNCDVLLLGPQVGYLLGKASSLGMSNNIPVEVISNGDYRRIDGEAILERALELTKK